MCMLLAKSYMALRQRDDPGVLTNSLQHKLASSRVTPAVLFVGRNSAHGTLAPKLLPLLKTPLELSSEIMMSDPHSHRIRGCETRKSTYLILNVRKQRPGINIDACSSLSPR